MLTPLTPAPSYAIVHPAQISPSYNQDFIGFGTYKGQQPGGSAGCPTYTGSGWNIYVDGAYGGVYFCSVLGNIAGNAQSQSFIVQRASPSCPGQYVPGWNVLWQRVVVGCVSATYTSADFVTAGAENFRAKSGQAIAVTYVQLQYRPVGFSYRDWPSHTDSKDSGYTIKPYGGLVNSYSITP